ncbi:hypothetical protein IJ21_27420 [Paenibacillus sp. 32O-W]|jgi:hypothetical protein|uniref:hypothetical protein n=1 Tax=Paenibacillus sp. 32O-W TaxID=1695218 RepID=UPI00072287D3|nr:hypothetical protein [Paenibacillus sp. 32O-W]ALS28138.1 hypothetical protein IJ21_27420 [Paenibacillus sp. 32O-W]
MTKLSFNLWNDLDRFDLGDSNARPGVYLGQQAAYLEKSGSAVFLRDEIPFTCFRLQAEVAIPEQVGFIGLVFGAKNSHNYELVYLAPEEIQYDPVMNGSMTWQIYNGTMYQKPLPNTTGKWVKFAVEVQPNGAAVYMGEDAFPQLVIPNLQHGDPVGKIGFWGYLPGYIRNLAIEEIQPTPITKRDRDLKRLSTETFITEWMVSPIAENRWTKAVVEENGTLNLNRIYTAEQGSSVQAKSTFYISEEKETLLTFGFSDHLRLWVNEEKVYQGDWRWNPPESDGRIRSNMASVPVRWMAGVNTIRAEITNNEFFGWGLCIKTGLSDMSFITEEK